jgi:hypothetical protein
MQMAEPGLKMPETIDGLASGYELIVDVTNFFKFLTSILLLNRKNNFLEAQSYPSNFINNCSRTRHALPFYKLLERPYLKTNISANSNVGLNNDEIAIFFAFRGSHFSRQIKKSLEVGCLEFVKTIRFKMKLTKVLNSGCVGYIIALEWVARPVHEE